MAQGIRKTITIPGMLVETIKSRYQEFDYVSFSSHGLELVCYDLRVQAQHLITLEIARDTQSAQDAIDRELVQSYQPSKERNGILIKIVDYIAHMRDTATRFRDTARLPAMSVKSERITFPNVIWPLVEVRWQELGYPSLSAYITGLIRYDLMVGGPHLFTSEDCRAETQEALNKETLRVREKGKTRKILLDYLIERAHGSELPENELNQIKARIACHLKSFGKVA